MPMYDHECSNGHIEEAMLPYETRSRVCSKCGEESKRIVSVMNSAQVDIFKAEHYEELGDDAPFISSRRQLSEECEKRGLVSRMLVEGYSSSAHRGRWI